MDQRKRARIPYGYKIVNGEAQIDEEESDRLLNYFSLYFDGGLSMSEAAREAGLPYCSRSLPRLFSRKEYSGTDFYPPLVTEEYQKQLLKEFNRRKNDSPFRPQGRKKKEVRIYTDFYYEGLDAGNIIKNTVDYLTALYLAIKPKGVQS